MKKMLETIYVLTPESYLYHRNDNICISIGGIEKASVPVHQVDSVVTFGTNSFSSSLLKLCGDHNITITFLSRYGQFQGRLCGPVSGNVLLRKRQYEKVEDDEFSKTFVKDLIFCKIKNSKTFLMRHARLHSESEKGQMLTEAVNRLSSIAGELDESRNVASMRGVEGVAASVYFSQFDNMLSESSGFKFDVRSRRPPQNEVNAVLSFVYTLLTHDTVSALETVGLDPAVGHLHTLRPGRPSFALDLMEELRSPLCDRLVLTMCNKGELSVKDFTRTSSAVMLNEGGRKKVLSQWRKRKQDVITHPFLRETIPIGLITYTQAMLFARVIRGDLDQYPPFVWR